MDTTHVPYRVAASYIFRRLQEANIALPQVGIICGSGLSELSNTLQEPTLTIKYGEIPGFPSQCTVEGHKGEIVFGILSDVPAMCFRGRFHSYEGHDMKTVVLPVYVMRCLRVQICIVTNAAGGLNPDYSVGDVIAISDHVAIPQLAGKNPLIGPNDEELGPRFPATSNAYDDTLRETAQHAATTLGIHFFRPHGTYCFVSGPMYESKAECRLLRMLGGDCVGMSTIPEIVAAHHCNMKTLCLSLITNKVVMAGDVGAPVATHAEVLEAVAERSIQMQTLVQQIVANMKDEVLPKLPPLRQVSLIIPDDLQRSFHVKRNNGNTKNRELMLSQSVPIVISACALVSTGVVIGFLLRRKS